MMKTAKSIDWITATQIPDPDGEVVKILPEWLKRGDETKAPPRFDVAWELKPAGMLALCASGTKCQLLQMTGSQLVTVRNEAGVKDDEILQHCVKTCQNITRIDYAVDIFETDASPVDFLTGWEQGKIKTRFRTVQHYKTLTGFAGETVYFGSKSSPQRIRIYDKAAEQKLLNEAWLRVELQCRKKKATPLAHDMARQGIVKCGDTKIRSLFDMPKQEIIAQAVDGSDANLTEVPRKAPAWEIWMNGQVLASIRNHVSSSSEREFLNNWLDTVAGIITEGRIAEIRRSQQ